MPTMSPSDAGRAGLSRTGLYRAAAAGSVTRIARGIYLPADTPAMDWDMVEAATRRSDATLCLTSALAHHDLVDEIPDTLDVAIPRGSRSPATERAITWHQFDTATFDLGRSAIPIEGSDLHIGIYSPERSIADAFRLRGYFGYEIARDALKEWLQRGGKPSELLRVSQHLPRTKGPVLHALEMLS